jgi:hypothetical protein
MNRREIETMLQVSDSDSSSDYDGTNDDPNWTSESELEESIQECDSLANGNSIGNNWDDNFSDSRLNSHIIYNPDINTTGINPDIVETMSDVSPIDFFLSFFDKEIIDLLVVETNRYANAKKNVANL